MSTNDKRAIANELRRVANDSLNGESLQRTLARITDADDSSWRGVMHRVADLIDYSSFICEKCGGEWPNDIGFEYCPYCGCTLQDGDE